MQIKEMAEEMGFEALQGIVDCSWVIGELIAVLGGRREGDWDFNEGGHQQLDNLPAHG